MIRIGLLSDTHGIVVDPCWDTVLREVDEIWHAGDIGTVEVVEMGPRGRILQQP